MEITAEVISAHFEKTEARNIRAAKNINRGKIQNKSKNPVQGIICVIFIKIAIQLNKPEIANLIQKTVSTLVCILCKKSEPPNLISFRYESYIYCPPANIEKRSASINL